MEEKFTPEEIQLLKETTLKDGGAYAYDLGNKCMAAGQYTKAFVCFESGAFYAQHAPSYVALAHLYEQGKGTNIDFFNAVTQYEFAAKHNSGEAQYYLGMYYLEGIFYLRDYHKAASYLSSAVKNGYKKAYYYLGILWWHGLAGEPNYNKAVRCFEKVLNEDDAYAFYYVGYAYYKGMGVAKDYRKAFLCFYKAAQLGYAAAQVNIPYCYYKGIGVDKDINKALEIATNLYEEYMVSDNNRLRYLLSKMLREIGNNEDAKKVGTDSYGNSINKPKDEILPPGGYYDYIEEHDIRRDAWLEKKNRYSTYSDEELDKLVKEGNDEALARKVVRLIENDKKYADAYNLLTKRIDEGGDKRLYSVLGYMYASGLHVTKDHEKAIACFKIAVEQGHSLPGLYNLGIAYKHAYKDYEKCNQYVLESAKAGYERAQEYLFEHYSKGDEGLPKDKDKAVYWGEKAAEGGSITAQRTLWDYYLDKDLKKGLRYMMDAADQGNAYSLAKLANRYWQGNGVEQNFDYACALYYLAAFNDNNDSAVNIACEYHYARNVKKNDIAALFWLKMAADANYTLAKVKLKQLFKVIVD